MRLARATLLLSCTVSAQPQVGQKLYQAHCAACHGDKGQGGRGTVLASPRLKFANDDTSMALIIRRGIPGTEMPPAPLNEDEIRQVAVYVREMGRTAPGRTSEAALRGRRIAETKGGCTKCHAVGGAGGVIGPNLADVAARRNEAYLRRALVEPEADVAENFGQYRWLTVIPDCFLVVRLKTNSGRAMTAVRVNEDAFAIQVRDLDGKFHSFFKDELKELHKDWGKTLMPSYRDKLTSAEIDDVVAWLLSLRGSP